MRRITIENFKPEGVVVDAGDFPTEALPLKIIDECKHVVCCDGASSDFLFSGRIPWRIVGDGDSIKEEVKTEYADIFLHNPDQETNDQTKSVEYLSNHGFKKIAIVGATGKREDHTLGNISLLMYYLSLGLEVRIYTDYGVFIPCDGDCEVFCRKNASVSIFNFGATNMRSEGLKWSVRDFAALWEGTLNKTLTGHFNIRANGSYLLFINY